MRKGKFFLLVLLIAVIAAGVYLYPAWKAARAIERKADSGCFAYEIEVALDKGRLPGEQNKVFETLAELIGLEESSVYCFTVKGQAWEGKNHLLIYPEGAADALIELYFNGDSVMINESMIYRAVRGYVIGKYPLLDYVMPWQEGNQYMTLEQVEQLFDVDLSIARKLGASVVKNRPTALQYFAMLALLQRQEQGKGYRFSMEKEQVKLCVEVADMEASHAVAAEFAIQEPASLAAKVKWLLSILGIRMPEELRVVESLSVTWAPGDGGSFDMPTDFVTQGTLDMIAEIRDWLKKLSGGGAFLDRIW